MCIAIQLWIFRNEKQIEHSVVLEKILLVELVAACVWWPTSILSLPPFTPFKTNLSMKKTKSYLTKNHLTKKKDTLLLFHPPPPSAPAPLDNKKKTCNLFSCIMSIATCLCVSMFSVALNTRLWYKNMADIFFFSVCLFVFLPPPPFLFFLYKVQQKFLIICFFLCLDKYTTWSKLLLPVFSFQSRIWKSIGGYNGRNGKMTRWNIGTKVPAIKGRELRFFWQV